MCPTLTFDKRQKLVDHRVGFASQLIYIAPPSFLPGISDPLAGRVRQQLLIGKRDTLSVTALMKNLPLLEHARPTRSKASGKPSTAARMPKARSQAVQVSGQVIPLAAAAREIAAACAACKAAISGTNEEYREACSQLFQRRVALEMLALAAHRGGLVEGSRNDSSLMIASAVAASLPLTMTTSQVRQQVRDMLRLVVDEAWIAQEWDGAGDASMIARFEQDVLNNASTLKSGRRYTYSKPRLLEEWQPTLEEVRKLGLMSLASEAQRQQVIRDAKKDTQTAAEAPGQAEARAQATEIHRLHVSGMSLRAIVRATGTPISTVSRILKAPTPPAAPVTAPAPVAQIGPPVAEIDMAVRLALIRGDDYADVIADQLGFTTPQVRLAMRRIGHTELIRPADLAQAA